MDIPSKEYDEILKEIESQDSPVGIDARKTHVIIIHKLQKIEDWLFDLENKFKDK